MLIAYKCKALSKFQKKLFDFINKSSFQFKFMNWLCNAK